jgi:uncharacterized protein (DUF362 family)
MADNPAFITKVRDLETDVSAAFEYIDWKNQLAKGDTVFIKPNFTYPYHKTGITTSPEIIEATLKVLTKRAGRVIVGESDGGNHSFTADQAFEGHDLIRMRREYGIELVNLSKIPSRRVEEKICGKNVWVRLPELLLEDVDCVVNLPVLKLHAMTKITLAMKNLWGCYPDTMRCLYHKHLGYKLVLLTKKLSPKIIMIDGLYGLDGHGPMYGTPKKMDLLIAANNPVVSDSVGANIMGMNPMDINHIRLAHAEGLGPIDSKEYRFNKPWKRYQRNFILQKTLGDYLSVLTFNSPTLAKLVIDSPLSPLIYGIVPFLRNKKEQEVADGFKKMK